MNLLEELRLNKDYIISPNKLEDNFDVYSVIWDNYSELSEYIDNLYEVDDVKEIYFYTLLIEDGSIRLIKGCNYKKRIGYILMTKNVFNIKETSIKVNL